MIIGDVATIPILIWQECGEDNSMIICDEIRMRFNSSGTKKVIATVSEKGDVHVTFKDMLFIDYEGNIILLEILEKSITNRNLVYSIWFKKIIAMNALMEDGDSFHIRAIPVRAIVSGKEFEKYYGILQKEMGDVDLSTVWVFKIVEISEKTLKKRIEEDEIKYPIIKHLDRMLQ